MTVLLVILSMLGVGVGILLMSQATTGVAIIAASGVVAIWARIAQASAHQAKLVELLNKQTDSAKAAPEPQPVPPAIGD